MKPFSIRLRATPDDASVSIAVLRGELAGPLCTTFETRLSLAIDEGCTLLVVDLAEVEVVGFDAWTVVLALVERIRRAGGELVVAGMRPDVRDAFELLRLDAMLLTFPSVEAARETLVTA